MFRFTTGFLLTALLWAAQTVPASQLPTSLNGRERVYLQDYWQAGVPGYCVTNRRDQAIRLRVSRWRSRDEDAGLLAVWDIPASGTVCRDMPGVQGEWLLSFSLSDGTRLGLMKTPVRPKLADESRVVSSAGLNGYCAPCGLWLEQRERCHPSGTPIHLDLLVEANNGTITLPRHADQEHAGLEALTLIRASSDTLPVRVLDHSIEIDTGIDVHRDRPQRIHLEFAARTVAATTLYSMSAQLRGTRRGRCCLTRGICVEPVK